MQLRRLLVALAVGCTRNADRIPAAVADEHDPPALEAACASGKWSACTELALRLDYGNGVPQDSRRAAELAKRACDGADGEGCRLYGDMMLGGGRGIPDDVSARARSYAQACELHALTGCNRLRAMQTGDITFGKDTGANAASTAALAALKTRCTAGAATACQAIAAFSDAGPLPKAP